MRSPLPWLTAARFFAALLVVIFHYSRKDEIFPIAIGYFGYEPVTFFFILSGFILTYMHLTKTGLNLPAWSFWQARALRIVPTYLFSLLVSLPFVVGGALKTGFNPDLLLVPIMLQSWSPAASLLWNSPAWSLSNEAAFYAFFPLLVWIVARGPMAVSISLAIASLAISTIVKHATPHDFAQYFPLVNLPQFFLGIVSARLFIAKSPPNLPLLILAFAAFFSVLFFKPTMPWVSDPLVLCPIFCALIYGLGGISTSSTVLLKLGEASYALYILHVPIWLWWDQIVRVRLGFLLPAQVDFSLYLSTTILASLVVTDGVRRAVLAARRSGSRPMAAICSLIKDKSPPRRC